jgi:4-hydroxybenzoate polyprenyltransferase
VNSYSLGGIVGAAGISILLMLGATPLNSTLAALAVMVLAVLVSYPGLFRFPHFSACISVRSERSNGTDLHPHNVDI